MNDHEELYAATFEECAKIKKDRKRPGTLLGHRFVRNPKHLGPETLFTVAENTRSVGNHWKDQAMRRANFPSLVASCVSVMALLVAVTQPLWRVVEMHNGQRTYVGSDSALALEAIGLGLLGLIFISNELVRESAQLKRARALLDWADHYDRVARQLEPPPASVPRRHRPLAAARKRAVR